MTRFDDFGLAPPLLKAVAELGFEEPTPIQAKVIPLLLKGERDLVALAQTGTGKTAAYGLPLLQLTDAHSHATQGLILCPTRELCLQIARDLAAMGRFAPHLRTLPVYGGSSIGEQARALQRGVHIVVATPGRLHDLLRRKNALLTGVRWVVLDEADEMMSMGFEEDLAAILQTVPKTARTLLFSATMPRQVAAMAGKFMRDPEEIIVGRRNAIAEKVEHECYTVHARDRYHALRRIVDARPGFYGIVFCRTRAETQAVAERLSGDGYNTDALHGDLSQDQRDRVMHGFRVRRLQILVATDVAARGLDVEDLTHVVHYDLPGDPDVYTHRSGRTGRAGKAGVSIVLVHLREDYKVRAIERIMNKRFEHKLVPTGREVCEARLRSLLEEVKRADAAGSRLDPYQPAIDQTLADMPREEIVRRLVLREFGPVLDQYEDAPDLNVHRGHERPEHRGHERPERRRPERMEHRGPPDRGPGDGSMVRLRINLGTRNALTPAELIGVINRATPGPMIRLGRIRILEQDSIFEAPAEAIERILPLLNRADYRGRAVRAVVERDPTHGSPSRAGGRHHPGRPPRRQHDV
jgi:ATP-dependent RNA helicase DeaD